jgi:NAD+ synthase (glutamine-hydrolysing)
MGSVEPSLFRIALAQVNLCVGDIEGNKRRIIRYVNMAREQQVDLVAFPELSITGYPPEDLLLKSSFIRESQDALAQVIARTKGIVAVVGFPYLEGTATGGTGRSGIVTDANRYRCEPTQSVGSQTLLFNAAAVADNGVLAAVCKKVLLPNYGVFDEKRYFAPGRTPLVFEAPGVDAFKGFRFGVNICEDIWSPHVARRQAQAGALVIVNISCSPYHVGKGEDRKEALSARSVETKAVICYVNLVGGQDELVFDGESVVFGLGGKLVARAPQFEESLLVLDIDVAEIAQIRKAAAKFDAKMPVVPEATRQTVDLAQVGMTQVGRAQVVRISGLRSREIGGMRLRRVAARRRPSAGLERIKPSIAVRYRPVEEVYRALVLGTRDYVRKNGFKNVAIGLSGGIDSSLVAAIAVDALGAINVHGILMPSRYTSKRSTDDARAVAENLRVKTMTIPIEEVFGAFLSTLRPVFARRAPDITEENIQARIRGNILMALSNKFGWLVLTTGNKSETAVGYSTLYGDTAGGFAVIKDVPKTLVYRLARFRNSLPPREAIPRSVLTKAPSAELRSDQKDEDSLPPYATLDPILEAYVERDRCHDEIAAEGFSPEVVDSVISMVDSSEYKRRQAPPGVKITPKAFGKDRRMPITNFYRMKKR